MSAPFVGDESSATPARPPTKDPIVSVIIPVYNQAEYLRAAIDSVLAQTWREFELIVVDDGSIDGTPDVIHSYGNQVFGFRKENGGGASALNYGLRRARGRWIAWLSADDAWEPTKLGRQLEAVEGKPEVGLVYTDYIWIDRAGKPLRRFSMPTVSSRASRLLRLLWGSYVNGSSALIRREVFDQVGLFDERDRFTPDYDFWLRLAMDHEALRVPEPLVRYRIHGAQSSGNILRMTEARHRVIARALPRMGRRLGSLGVLVHVSYSILRLTWDLRRKSTGRGVSPMRLLRPLAGFFVLLVRSGT